MMHPGVLRYDRSGQPPSSDLGWYDRSRKDGASVHGGRIGGLVAL